MDVDAVADELYGVPPGEFVALRDARVKQARADGDRPAATEIAALRRPTVVAWLANQLARQAPDRVAPLVELGAALREATATLSGPELRALSAQRQQLVQALVREARALGRDAGQRVTEDVARGLEDTFSAALADPGAAELLVRARLSDGMATHGFGGAPGGPGAVGTGRSARTGTGAGKAAGTGKAGRSGKGAKAAPDPDEQRRAEQRGQLERDLGDAWATARESADTRESAVANAERAVRDLGDSERTVARMRAELEAAEMDVARAAEDHAGAVAARDQAESLAQAARQRVADLQSRLDGL